MTEDPFLWCQDNGTEINRNTADVVIFSLEDKTKTKKKKKPFLDR